MPRTTKYRTTPGGGTRRWAGLAVLAVLLTSACGTAVGDPGVDPAAATDTPPRPQLLLTFDDQQAGPAAGKDRPCRVPLVLELLDRSRGNP